MIDIVIPHYGADRLLDRCLASIDAAGGPARHVIVHDNNRVNVGFAAGVNTAVARGSASHVVLLNNDTAVAPGWLESLAELVDSDPSLAAVGPLSSASSQWQGVAPVARWLGADVPCPGFISTRDGRFPSTPAFWCVMIRRAVWEHVGELDTGYFMYGEDDDWCLRARGLGYEFAVDLSVVVHHDHRANYDEVTRLHHCASRERFKRRWKEAYESRHWSVRVAAGDVAALPVRRIDR